MSEVEAHAEGCPFPSLPCGCDDPPDIDLYPDAWPSRADIFKVQWRMVLTAAIVCLLILVFAISCVLISTKVNGF
jgi:hypothetical protein